MNLEDNNLIENKIIINDFDKENLLQENLLQENLLQENLLDENQINSFPIETLNSIKQTIENMDKVHHIEILKLLNNEKNVNINENNNGSFINLTEIKNESIEKLKKYIDYFKKQQNQLINFEDKKKQIENCFFN